MIRATKICRINYFVTIFFILRWRVKSAYILPVRASCRRPMVEGSIATNRQWLQNLKLYLPNKEAREYVFHWNDWSHKYHRCRKGRPMSRRDRADQLRRYSKNRLNVKWKLKLIDLFHSNPGFNNLSPTHNRAGVQLYGAGYQCTKISEQEVSKRKCFRVASFFFFFSLFLNLPKISALSNVRGQRTNFELE